MEEEIFPMSSVVLSSAIGRIQILCNMLILLNQMSYNINRAMLFLIAFAFGDALY